MAYLRAYIYLIILAAALVAWIPLYPVLYALQSDHVSDARDFFRNRPRYIYFGDSVIKTTSECDADRRSIIDLLPTPIPGQTLAITQGAGDARLWKGAARFYASRNSGFVRAAIIPINMEVFSIGWEHALNTALDYPQARMFYGMASGNFTAGEYLASLTEVYDFLKPYRTKRAIEVWTRQPVLVGSKSVGTAKFVIGHMLAPKFPCNVDVARYAEQLRLRFAYNYGAPVAADDPYFSDLDETARRLEQAKIHPLFYITPLNLDDIRRFGGPELLAQVRRNLATVRQVAHAKGWDMIDLSGSLSTEHFITRECACEHVDAFGRSLIARNVGSALRRFQ